MAVWNAAHGRRGNPIFPSAGEAEDLFVLGFGVALSAGLNDNIVNPFASGILSPMLGGITSSDAGQKVFDAITTWGTAIGEGELGDMLGVGREARMVEKAGKALAIAKLATIVLPGYSLNGKLPSFIQVPTLPGPAPVGTPLLPGGATAPPGAPLSSASTTGPVPRPAVAGLTAGSRPTGL